MPASPVATLETRVNSAASAAVNPASAASAAHLPTQRGSAAAQRAWALGVALARSGALDKALRHFKSACRAAPKVSLYWLNLANLQRRLHLEAAALASAQRAFALDRQCRTSCHLAVELLRGQHQHAQALATLDALRQDISRDVQHGLLRGSVLAALDRPTQAAAEFLQVLVLQPGQADAYMQLGFVLASLRQYTEAAECFRAVAQVHPGQTGAAVYAAHYAAWACDWREADADAARLQAALQRPPAAAGGTGFSPFCLLAMDDDVVLHRQAARLEARRLASQIRAQAGWTDAACQQADAPCCGPASHPLAAQAAWATPSGRCRVGLVSADFRTHATGMLLVQTLEQLDRSRFELFLYSHGADDGTPLRRRIEAAADHFVDCSALSLLAQAQRIRDDGVLILIDMSGYTTGSRLALFALRPAPVQAVWLAYPGTLGAPWVDYLIGDPVITPQAHAADFDEHLVQLPLCYEPTDEQREHPEPTASRSDLGLPEEGFVYACFNQSYKISEPQFSAWCRVLQRVPGSVLWLLVPQPGIQAALLQRAAERGIAPERIVFAPFVPTTEHLARLPLADVFLDTFPYGAHTTCSDALWMGLPVLTRSGRSFASRVAASLLHAVGLPALVTDNAADYEELAVRLACDREALCDIRDHLWDNRRDLPLFDNSRFSAELGEAFGRMAGRWRQGLAPAVLPVLD